MKKDYQVSYYLGNFYHAYVVEATNEAKAIQKVIDTMPKGSQEILHDFKIKRYFQEW